MKTLQTGTNARVMIKISPDFLTNNPQPFRYVADSNKRADKSWMTRNANEGKTFASARTANKWISDRGIAYTYEIVPA
jgi:hypothetical protein